MATFQYAKKRGGLGAIEGANADDAIKRLPPDADPRSGVMAPLSGTGTPAPSTTVSSTLPSSGGGTGGKLLSFADSLDQVVTLAREKRNKSSTDLMTSYRGTVAASDFNSILGNLNAASDKMSENLIKRVTDIQNPDILTVTNDEGTVSGIDKNTGEVLWSRPGVGNRQGAGGVGIAPGGTFVSGDLVLTAEDLTQGSNELKQSSTQGPEADGKYADPNLYVRMYKQWIDAHGKTNDFLKQYPLATWINPASLSSVSTQLTEHNNAQRATSSDDFYDAIPTP